MFLRNMRNMRIFQRRKLSWVETAELERKKTLGSGGKASGFSISTLFLLLKVLPKFLQSLSNERCPFLTIVGVSFVSFCT
jgi:hypothetical protein